MKKIASLFVVLALALLFAPMVSAVQNEKDVPDVESILGNVQKKLDQSTSEDIKKLLSDSGISVSSPESIGNMKPKNITEKVIDYFVGSLKAPFVMLGRILAVIMLCAVIRSVSTQNDAMSRVIELLCLLCTVVLITDTVRNSFVSIKESIESVNTYLTAYLPIFSGITLAGGNVIGSNGYLAIMLFVCEIMGVIASKVLLPFLSLVLAVTLVSCINPKLCFSEIAFGIKKVVTVGLGLVMTVFTGIMTVQGMTGAAADNVSSKAIRFAASSFIPIIGASVSEAYSAVKGSLGVIRTTVGSIGIIVLLFIVLRPLISVLAVRFVIFLAKCANDLFGQRQAAELLKSVNSVLSIAMSILIAYAVIFTVATSVMMMTAMSVGG